MQRHKMVFFALIECWIFWSPNIGSDGKIFNLIQFDSAPHHFILFTLSPFRMLSSAGEMWLGYEQLQLINMNYFFNSKLNVWRLLLKCTAICMMKVELSTKRNNVEKCDSPHWLPTLAIRWHKILFEIDINTQIT